MLEVFDDGTCCMREPWVEVLVLGCDRMQREQAKVAHHAKVTGGCDSETFSLATALRRLNPHVASRKRVSCEQQLDLSDFEHRRRHR